MASEAVDSVCKTDKHQTWPDGEGAAPKTVSTNGLGTRRGPMRARGASGDANKGAGLTQAANNHNQADDKPAGRTKTFILIP